jgi:UDPglucose 6-dehydrogenase
LVARTICWRSARSIPTTVKDIHAFMAQARSPGADHVAALLLELDRIDTARPAHLVELARELVGGNLEGRENRPWALAFKPHSDDVRESPSVAIALRLMREGAVVVMTDPHASANARHSWPDLEPVDTVDEACRDAELVTVLTEWPQYACLDPATLQGIVAWPRILDGRNCLDPDLWHSAGWTYRALGALESVIVGRA